MTSQIVSSYIGNHASKIASFYLDEEIEKEVFEKEELLNKHSEILVPARLRPRHLDALKRLSKQSINEYSWGSFKGDEDL